MAVTNISQGGNKTIQVLGLKELQAKIKEIQTTVVRDEAAAVMADCAEIARDEIESRARTSRVPHEALKDIYIYTRQPGGSGKRDSVSSLAGLRKKGRRSDAKGYVKWNASRQVGAFDKTQRTRGRKKLTIPGNLIGENLATMVEFGTTKMQPRPFFRPAIQAIRARVLGIIASGYRNILERHSA